MTNTSKEEFIEVANSLQDSYADFARCLYSEAFDEGLIEPVFNFMTTSSDCTTDEVLIYLDSLLGSPSTRLEIVDSEARQLVAA